MDQKPMDENPYRSPIADDLSVGTKEVSRKDLRSLALYQKGILACIILYVIALICTLALPQTFYLHVQIALGLVAVAGAVFVFLSTMKVYGVGIGILLGLLAYVPLIGLIVLLVVSGKVTAVLRQNGIRVGLTGADLSTI